MISNSSDEYLTIKSLVRSKRKVEGSIFIATAIPINSEEDAKDWIQKISSEFFDATHNCFAYRIKKTQDESFKFSDAGEPRGTAGKPILSAIQSENLYDVLVVVTRYFGGVKLGTGGLSRAYRQSAQSVLRKAEKVTRWITSEITFSYPLNMTGKVNQIFGKYGIPVKDQSYEDSPIAKIVVRISLLEKIKKALVEATNGQVKFK
ncbi:MAG: YigZ family protein [candidate division Zixibacteria bacterium]|nr:YigZ family protein [candidate division Zixibacteria bacterium]